jgi:hypothetical protein
VPANHTARRSGANAVGAALTPNESTAYITNVGSDTVSGEGRTGDGRERAGGRINRVPRNVIVGGIRHVEEPAAHHRVGGKVHRSEGRTHDRLSAPVVESIV